MKAFKCYFKLLFFPWLHISSGNILEKVSKTGGHPYWSQENVEPKLLSRSLESDRGE